MKFMILIYGDETVWASMPPAEMAEVMGAFNAYTEALKTQKKHVASSELKTVSTAQSVTVRNGVQRMTDGPYVDTKEQLGGFYFIEAEDQADALAWAARCPAARYGGVELRPVVER